MSDYKPIKTIVDESEPLLSSTITASDDRLGIKRYTFAIFREFIKRDNNSFTPWFRREHIAALRRLLDQTEKELEIMEAYTKRELLESKQK